MLYSENMIQIVHGLRMYKFYIFLRNYIIGYFIYRKIIQDLNKYTEEELKDMGIFRCNIDYIALETLKNKGYL